MHLNSCTHLNTCVVKVLLQNEDYARLTLAAHPPDPHGDITDIHDANRYRTHPLFSKSTSAIAIVEGLDEFEICNPVGVWHGLQKILTVVAINMNLPPSLRYRRENILLVSVCFATCVKETRMVKIFGGDPNDPTCTSPAGMPHSPITPSLYYACACHLFRLCY